MKSSMNILALDYGKKRIGLAWVQSGLDVVLPFGLIEKQDNVGKKNLLVSLVESEKIDKIIIGLPTGLDGKENENTKNVRIFVEDIKAVLKIPVEFFDERYSSKQADSMGGSVSRDEKSAMVILQSYLDSKK